MGIMPDHSLILLSILIFFAGIVDALAGGGGLITVPGYLALGLPPQWVLGTNKLASSLGISMSSFQYFRRLKLDLFSFWPAIASSLTGSVAGACLAMLISPNFLRYFLLTALPVVVYSILMRRNKMEHEKDPAIGVSPWLYALVAFPIGFYDGFFGPGTGVFFALALNRVCHHSILEATGRAKVLNLASNMAALAAFLVGGRVHLGIGLTMGLVSICGHYVGARMGIRKGAKIIRPAILVVCAGLFIKIAFDIVQPYL